MLIILSFIVIPRSYLYSKLESKNYKQEDSQNKKNKQKDYLLMGRLSADDKRETDNKGLNIKTYIATMVAGFLALLILISAERVPFLFMDEEYWLYPVFDEELPDEAEAALPLASGG